MKCTNCGKNNASFHYSYTINGETTEQHLCPACAAKLEPEKEFSAKANSLFRDFHKRTGGFFDEDFFGRGLLDGDLFGGELPGDSVMDRFMDMGRSFFGGFPGIGFLPAVFMPVTGIPAGGRQERETPKEKTQAVDPELARKRQINALREQMRAAAEKEDYESAAKLRDELRSLERDGGDR